MLVSHAQLLLQLRVVEDESLGISPITMEKQIKHVRREVTLTGNQQRELMMLKRANRIIRGIRQIIPGA